MKRPCPNGAFDFWPAVGDDFNEFGIQQLDEMDTLLFGRVTYEVMAAHWRHRRHRTTTLA